MLRASSSSIVVVNRRRSSSLCLRAQPNQTPTHATRCLVAAALQTTEETGDATRAKANNSQPAGGPCLLLRCVSGRECRGVCSGVGLLLRCVWLAVGWLSAAGCRVVGRTARCAAPVRRRVRWSAAACATTRLVSSAAPDEERRRARRASAACALGRASSPAVRDPSSTPPNARSSATSDTTARARRRVAARAPTQADGTRRPTLVGQRRRPGSACRPTKPAALSAARAAARPH